MCYSAVKCECFTLRETDNNSEYRTSRGWKICSVLVLFSMNGSHCFGDGSHPSAFPIKQPMKWIEPNWIQLKEWERSGFEQIHPSLSILCPCLSPSVCLPICDFVNWELSGDISHPLPYRQQCVQLWTTLAITHFLCFAVSFYGAQLGKGDDTDAPIRI